MDIIEIENKHIKISPNSITVKRNDGKTCGVVRNVCKFKNLQPNKQIDYSFALKKAGVWNSGIDGLMDSVIITDNQLYYLHNLKPIETYNKIFKDVPGWESEAEYAEKRIKIAENMKEFATVIPCYIER